MRNVMNEEQQAMDTRQQVERYVTDVVKELLQMAENGGVTEGGISRLCWTGTKCDLLELLRIAYDSGQIMTREGVQISFSRLVECVFRLLGVSPIHNPYARLQRAEQRKGIRAVSVQQRLEYIAENEGVEKMMETVWGVIGRG